MDDTSVAIAALGIVVTSVGALIWIVKFLMVQMKKSLDANTKALALNTKATQNADKYLRERNGRDNEVHTELIASLKELPDVIHTKLSKQSVKEQKVLHQTIESQG